MSEPESAVEVYTWPLPPGRFNSAPIEERTLLIGASFVANELNALRKLLLLSEEGPGGSEIERNARTMQSLMLLRFFAMKAHSGYEFIRARMSTPALRLYPRDPDSGLIQLQRKLRNYFSGNSLLEIVRNKLAAHQDINALATALSQPIEKEMHFYVAEQQGLALYYAAEEMAFEALKHLVNSEETNSALMERLIDDVDEVSSLLVEFAQGVIVVFGKRHMGKTWYPGRTAVQKIDLMPAHALSLPFFVDFRGHFK